MASSYSTLASAPLQIRCRGSSSCLLPLSSLRPPKTSRSTISRSKGGTSSSSISTSANRRGCSAAASPNPSSSSSNTASALEVDVRDLENLTVDSAATGERVAFGDLWKPDEVAVVALMRHFGCFCCWELASELKDFKPKLDSAGVKLIAIGVGTSNKAQILAEQLPFPKECLFADPEYKVYKTLGLYYGLSRTFFNPASAKVFSRRDSVLKALKNYTMKATPDDPSTVLQQGGMLVFKGKDLVYARKDEGTGDHAPLDDVLQYCCT